MCFVPIYCLLIFKLLSYLPHLCLSHCLSISDVYMLHWPDSMQPGRSNRELRAESWRALEELIEQRKNKMKLGFYCLFYLIGQIKAGKWERAGHDMQLRATGWNQTRGRCSNMGRTLFQVSYEGAPMKFNLIIYTLIGH